MDNEEPGVRLIVRLARLRVFNGQKHRFLCNVFDFKRLGAALVAFGQRNGSLWHPKRLEC